MARNKLFMSMSEILQTSELFQSITKMYETGLQIELWRRANPGLPIGWFEYGRGLVWDHINACEHYYLAHCHTLFDPRYILYLYSLLDPSPFDPGPTPESAPIPHASAWVVNTTKACQQYLKNCDTSKD